MISSSWHSDIIRIIDSADKDQCYRWALFDRPKADRWSQGHVTLLGDSAHPMLPYLAQGAVMAIEDAAVLTRCLDTFDQLKKRSTFTRGIAFPDPVALLPSPAPTASFFI